jgi:hypothetical protein
MPETAASRRAGSPSHRGDPASRAHVRVRAVIIRFFRLSLSLAAHRSLGQDPLHRKVVTIGRFGVEGRLYLAELY